MKNLYEILEVSENASKDVIEKVYKVLAKKYHPDLQQTQQEKIIAEERMKEINEAYSVLSDDEKRLKYNQKLEVERRILENKKNNNVNYSVKGSPNNFVNNSNVYNNTYKDSNENKGSSYERNNIQNNALNDKLNNKMNKNLKRKQKKLEKELKRNMEDAYLEAYGDYLRKNGYRVKYRFDYRNLPLLIGSVLFFVIVGWLLWLIPITHELLIKIYNNNIIIQKLVNIIIDLFRR